MPKSLDRVFAVSLMDFNTPGRFKNSPTLATGDFKISQDGGALVNLSNLPVVSPAGGAVVLVTLTTDENDANTIAVVCRDQTEPPEWCDQMITFLSE